ncbi:MAG: type IV toxin-antitoxin system AbiEi family antitoxin [Bacteroidales bacterium]|nr:type IV toxin-antitoxin system AbiEi family antitoxin [Bacteroidales bacterium]
MNHPSISDYIFQIQSQGRYSLTLGELKRNIGSSDKALLQNLHRLKSKNQIAQIRKEFYIIIPPQYSHQGTLPCILFLDDMMKFLNREYYLGLYSAAALHGAGHQQPMESQVMIQKPTLRDINNKKQIITFFTKNHWESEWIDQKKTESGYVNVSSPELTAVDLIHHHIKIGGLNRIIPILEDLTESIKVTKLSSIGNKSALPTIQRLGYILEQLGEEKLSEALAKTINKKKTNTAPLSLSHKNKEGRLNEKWNLKMNAKLDI